MANLIIVATQVGVLFALMAVGFACRKLKLLDDAAVKGLVNVLVLIVTPCLVVDCFQRPFAPEQLKSLGVAFGVALAAHAVVIAFATAFVRHPAADSRKVLQLATVFSNAGFMGIPLEQAVFGADGVFFGIVYVVVFNLLFWSWGYCTMRGLGLRHLGVAQLRTVCVNPGTVGLAVGLPLFLCSARLPAVVAQPIGFLAGLNTPVAMLVIGYYLAGAKFVRVRTCGGASLAAFVRLVAYPLALVAALYPFRHALDRTMMLTIVTAASAPVAAMTTIFAAKYGRDVDLSVGLVSGTTLLSIFTMPPVIALAMAVL